MIRLALKTVAVRDDGCYSALVWDGKPFAVSVEHTFSGGTILKNGPYMCVASTYFKGGYPTFEIVVPKHSRILFHKGNTELDSIGCVVVGESFGHLNDTTAVLDSKGGFAELMSLAAGLKYFNMEVSGR